MGKVIEITRRSIHAFFQSYHSFATTAALLVFPVSAATLLSQSLTLSSSPILRTVSSRLRLLFEAAGFPATSQFFSLLSFKISQTILTSISTLPFTHIFLILAKASVIQIIHEFPRCRLALPPFSSLLHLYPSLLLTKLTNSLAILSANATIFSILLLVFNVADILHLSSSNSMLVLSAASAIFYSIVIANTMVACNLAIVISAMENSGGYLSILKALVLIRGRTATAITLALPASLSMAAVEALFQCRVMRPYRLSGNSNPSVIWEAFLITYIYSLLIVLDTIITCMFLKSCKMGEGSHWYAYDCQTDSEPEAKGAQQA
ncbi:uncharacterized protein [Elaeis guineensis]|uniref:Uncharacterized protein LOC105058004 n=1 Tax=Elaeis guineensis var. tenera TaxID=51953 RepID=A0A6I9S818_ELAGV|nr:uncharacterized protein LOC105058004 [Elaeis guineensis]